MSATGSFIDGGILTASFQVMNNFGVIPILTSQSINYPVNSHVLYLITYPVTVGYTGSAPVELIPLPTQSISSSVVPTIGQVWPR